MTLVFLFLMAVSIVVAFGLFILLVESGDSVFGFVSLGLAIAAVVGFALLAFNSHEQNWNETCRSTGGTVMPSGVCDYPGED